MATVPPVAPPAEPGEPPNRWPWVVIGLALLIVVVAALFYLFNRPRAADVSATPTATLTPAVLVVTATPLPTLTASPTLVPSATPVPSPTPAPPTATPLPVPTTAPTAPAAQVEPTVPPAAQAAPPAGQTAPTPTLSAAAGSATSPLQAAGPPTVPPTPTAAVAPSPTSFAGQVANAGGAGNTRSDLDAAYGAPVGETPEHLVVYRKAPIEYHVGFVPDPQGRAALVVELPQQGQSWTPDQATAESRKLLPKDAQPPSAAPEGNDQFIIERYTSQSLGQALPASTFTANRGQPGQFLVVYVRDQQQQGRISRIIIGAGTDPQALIQQGH